MSAGLGDIVTLGYFGDVQLAENYPDFVWQENWSYRPDEPAASTVLSADAVPRTAPDIDLGADTLPGRVQRDDARYTESPPQ